jgi:drug/metabolite transporter (DMT)-like permease
MLAAVACAVTGTALLVGGLGNSSLHAGAFDWAIGFSSAVSFAFYIVYSKRGLSRYPPPTLLFYTFLIAASFWAVVTPPWRIVAAGYGAGTWALFLTIGVGSTLVPFSLFNAGLRRLRPAETAVLATIEPVIAIALAALFLGEGLRGLQWIGAGLVIGATLLASAQAPDHATVVAERL